MFHWPVVQTYDTIVNLWGGGTNNEMLLLIYQQNLLLLFIDLNTSCWRRMELGQRSAPNTETNFAPTPNKGQTVVFFVFVFYIGPWWFKCRSNRLDSAMTKQQGAYLSLMQFLVQDCKKRQNCKKGFLCSRSTHQRHCIPGFSTRALEVSFIVCVLSNCLKKKCLWVLNKWDVH